MRLGSLPYLVSEEENLFSLKFVLKGKLASFYIRMQGLCKNHMHTFCTLKSLKIDEHPCLRHTQKWLHTENFCSTHGPTLSYSNHMQ